LHSLLEEGLWFRDDEVVDAIFYLIDVCKALARDDNLKEQDQVNMTHVEKLPSPGRRLFVLSTKRHVDAHCHVIV